MVQLHRPAIVSLRERAMESATLQQPSRTTLVRCPRLAGRLLLKNCSVHGPTLPCPPTSMTLRRYTRPQPSPQAGYQDKSRTMPLSSTSTCTRTDLTCKEKACQEMKTLSQAQHGRLSSLRTGLMIQVAAAHPSWASSVAWLLSRRRDGAMVMKCLPSALEPR